MTTRKYSSRAQQTTLSSSITSGDVTMTVGSGANLMGGKTPAVGETYTVVIDPDTALEEIVDVSNHASGNTLTIARGIDGSTAVAHSAGAIVRHMVIGRDLSEANIHIEATTGHGATGAVVGTTNTQTLTNKTLTSPVITTPTITSLTLGDGNIVFEGATADAFETTLTVVDPTADRTVSIPDATTTLVGTDTTQTLTNKTLTSPTITGTGAIAGTFTGGLTGNVTGNLTGNVTGNVTGTSGSTTGNAATATALATGRTISLTGDVSGTSASFDGTGNASITAAIAANIIVDADINASAAITATKIAGTAVTQADTGTVTSTMILDGTILNADINASAAIALSKLATDPLARANHTGTQLAATVSDFDTQVRTSRLDQMAVPTATVSLNSQKITNLDTPTASADAANKGYVDTQITNLIAAAPGALDTLDELAAALGDDASFATTVTNSLAAKLPLAGGTMSGAIAMGTSKITGLGTPTVSTDAATKAYADTMLPLAGGTMSGVIAMGTNKITGVGDPTNAQDVVTKYYLDNVVLAPSNLTGPITSTGSATSIASQTGTGTKFVVDTSPTLVTPVLGVATATSINGTTIPSSKTLVATDSTQYVVPSQTSNSGKFLTTDGTTSSWGTVASYSAPTLGSTVINSGTTVTTISGLTDIVLNGPGSVKDELTLLLMGAL